MAEVGVPRAVAARYRGRGAALGGRAAYSRSLERDGVECRGGRPPGTVPVYRIAARHAGSRCARARLHATSRSEFEELDTRWGPGRTVYIPNGVELPSGARGDAPGGRARFNLPPTAPLILFLGRIHPIKRLDLLAAAFARVRAQHPDAHLVIAGPDEEGHRGRIAPLFTPFGSSVTWTGRVDQTGKRQLLEAASVLVLCSNSESFGMSAAEAMAAAVPVVVTRTCPWPEVESHDAGFWVEQNPEAIAVAVITLLANEPAAQAMGRRGRALIAGHYSWPQAASALINEYEAIASTAVSVG